MCLNGCLLVDVVSALLKLVDLVILSDFVSVRYLQCASKISGQIREQNSFVWGFVSLK